MSNHLERKPTIAEVRIYTMSEIADLLQKAEDMGFSLEAGCELEKLTVGELNVLVNRRQ